MELLHPKSTFQLRKSTKWWLFQATYKQANVIQKLPSNLPEDPTLIKSFRVEAARIDTFPLVPEEDLPDLPARSQSVPGLEMASKMYSLAVGCLFPDVSCTSIYFPRPSASGCQITRGIPRLQIQWFCGIAVAFSPQMRQLTLETTNFFKICLIIRIVVYLY